MHHLSAALAPRWLARLKKRRRQSGAAAGDPAKLPRGIQPVHSGDELLASHPDVLNRIILLAGVPQAHFEILYRAVLRAFAAFVQALPAEGAGGPALLERALARTVTSLTRRQGYFVPLGAEPHVILAKADIWTYAVFTAALLRHLAPLTAGVQVALFDEHGRPLGAWTVWRGAMAAQNAAGYRLEAPLGPCAEWQRWAVPVLARRCLPAAGLGWLWQHRELLAPWLAALRGEAAGAGVLGEMIGLS